MRAASPAFTPTLPHSISVVPHRGLGRRSRRGVLMEAKRWGSRIRTGSPAPNRRLCPGSGSMPSIAAWVNGGVLQRYPPIPALIRNENPGFPHGSATNFREPKLKVKS